MLNIDLLHSRETIYFSDKIALVALTSLFIGIMGTVPGHEMSHRIKKKFDLFIGNWLLSLSWDCAFAIEHVYGHHKNVGLAKDPATANRGENVYKFVFSAIIK
jgi:alkane 1-monooxygenase